MSRRRRTISKERIPTGQEARPFDHVTRSIPARRFHLEYECDGAAFVWHGAGLDADDADRNARADLAQEFAAFNESARLTARQEAGS